MGSSGPTPRLFVRAGSYWLSSSSGCIGNGNISRLRQRRSESPPAGADGENFQQVPPDEILLGNGHSPRLPLLSRHGLPLLPSAGSPTGTYSTSPAVSPPLSRHRQSPVPVSRGPLWQCPSLHSAGQGAAAKVEEQSLCGTAEAQSRLAQPIRPLGRRTHQRSSPLTAHCQRHSAACRSTNP